MATSQAHAAARELLHVVMLVMRTLAADMRRSSRPLAPTQMGSLMRIAAGPCRMSDLARHQAVSLPTISKSVDMLVRRGWVERWVDKEDRRQSLVRLTPKGRRVLAEIKDRSERHVAEVARTAQHQGVRAVDDGVGRAGSRARHVRARRTVCSKGQAATTSVARSMSRRSL
jgi:DNA-binding MarR family transcriptional regulator